jgi:hypothetical protein
MSNEGTLVAGYEHSASTKILPSLTPYFARSSASACESTLIAACGWRALIARIALPLSGMATRHHSCSGEPPSGFGRTITIFHPVVMRRRYPSPFVPARSRASTLSLPHPASHGEADILGQAEVLRICDKLRIGLGGPQLWPPGQSPAQARFFVLSRSGSTRSCYMRVKTPSSRSLRGERLPC